MRTLSTTLTIVLILLVGLAGYYYLDQVVPLHSETEKLKQEIHELQFETELLEQKNQELSGQLEEQIKQVSQEKEEEIRKITGTYEELIDGLQEQVEKGEVTITRLADQLSVNIVDRILFPSGSAEVRPEGISVLQSVGKILKQAQNKQIRVVGHTDNVPIHPRLQDKFPTNWELSSARATNVVRILNERVGINGNRLEASAFNQYRPIATNRTKKGRARNRRIEILLLPKARNVSKLADGK